MKLTKEPKEVDFVIKSEPWSEKDLADFRALMQEIRKKTRRKTTARQKSTKTHSDSKSL